LFPRPEAEVSNPLVLSNRNGMMEKINLRLPDPALAIFGGIEIAGGNTW
jgi:hypothetical protein